MAASLRLSKPLTNGLSIPCSNNTTIKRPTGFSGQFQKVLAVFPNHIFHLKALIRAKCFACWLRAHIWKLPQANFRKRSPRSRDFQKGVALFAVHVRIEERIKLLTSSLIPSSEARAWSECIYWRIAKDLGYAT
mmetsp:Transcript_53972/g.101229  ORF Transcript_53972/g.101229 Transcript_53972/m.101229 type:complete len:134 (-) Transcript_53972:268-669(-)